MNEREGTCKTFHSLNTYKTCTSLSETVPVVLPRLERVLDLSMMALLLGLFSTDLLANDMSAVTLVMDILKQHKQRYVSSRANRRAAQQTLQGFDCSPPVKPVLQEVKQRLLHHICHLRRRIREGGGGQKGRGRRRT